MEEEKTVAQLLGIERTEGWLEEQNQKVVLFLKERVNMMDTLVTQSNYEWGNHTLISVIELSGNMEVLIKLLQLFLTIGFMKGKADQEDVDQLEKLMEEV